MMEDPHWSDGGSTGTCSWFDECGPHALALSASCQGPLGVKRRWLTSTLMTLAMSLKLASRNSNLQKAQNVDFMRRVDDFYANRQILQSSTRL